jgi:hypothetical protein
MIHMDQALDILYYLQAYIQYGDNGMQPLLETHENECHLLNQPITYGSAPSPKIRYGFSSATCRIVCANTEFAHANHGRV